MKFTDGCEVKSYNLRAQGWQGIKPLCDFCLKQASWAAHVTTAPTCIQDVKHCAKHRADAQLWAWAKVTSQHWGLVFARQGACDLRYEYAATTVSGIEKVAADDWRWHGCATFPDGTQDFVTVRTLGHASHPPYIWEPA
jgi:hypothetical protein